MKLGMVQQLFHATQFNDAAGAKFLLHGEAFDIADVVIVDVAVASDIADITPILYLGGVGAWDAGCTAGAVPGGVVIAAEPVARGVTEPGGGGSTAPADGGGGAPGRPGGGGGGAPSPPGGGGGGGAPGPPGGGGGTVAPIRGGALAGPKPATSL